jgi:hypothetical protein
LSAKLLAEQVTELEKGVAASAVTPFSLFLFDAVRPWLAQLLASSESNLSVPCCQLTALATAAGLVTGSGLPLQFVPPVNLSEEAYELRAQRTGEVFTRPENWHDFFNALIWLAFPLTKAAMNRRHVEEISRNVDVRGAVRDAITQFDECGVIVLTDQPGWWSLIQQHRWREAFVEQRGFVQQHCRFLVYGHATLDALREPYFGLCGKALCVQVPASVMALETPAQCGLVDKYLAKLFVDRKDLSPRDWQPLPLLGLPGVTVDSENPAYYDDERQFRPRRSATADTMRAGKSTRQSLDALHLEESPGLTEQDAG